MSDAKPPPPEPHAHGSTGLIRSIGQFVGEITKAIQTPAADATGTERTVISQHTDERTSETAETRLILRRTTIDEIELSRPPGDSR